MDEFTIYCSEEQARKALELGAQLKRVKVMAIYDIEEEPIYKTEMDWFYIPTAEQMLGWLEAQDGIGEVDIYEMVSWCYDVHYVDDSDFNLGYKTRKEATIAAIDAALEYLIKNKEQL